MIRVSQQSCVGAKIQSICGLLFFDYQLAGEQVQAKPPPGPKLIRLIVGDDAFAYVEAVSLTDGDRTTDADLAMLTKMTSWWPCTDRT